MAPSLRSEQLAKLNSSLLTSPFPYPVILLNGETASGKSYILKECLFQHVSKKLQIHHPTINHPQESKPETNTGMSIDFCSIENRNMIYDQQNSLHEHETDEIHDCFMRNKDEMFHAGHFLQSSFSSDYLDEMKSDSSIHQEMGRTITFRISGNNNTDEYFHAPDYGRVIISIDCHELPFEEQALFGLLSLKLQRISSSHFDIVSMLQADERFSNEEAILYRRRRRGGVTTSAAYFLQEMERIHLSYHTPDLIIVMNNATEFLNNVGSAPFHHWIGIFSSMYHIFEGRACLVLESCQPKSFFTQDPYAERDILNIFFPKYTISELKSIILEKNHFHAKHAHFSEFLDLLLGSTGEVTRRISLLSQLSSDIFPFYCRLPTFSQRLQFLQGTIKSRLKYIKNPKLRYMEIAHTVDIKEHQEIILGSDEWIDESSNKLSHRQVESELIDPYTINKDMTLLHSLVTIATYVAKVQPKELDVNMYITEKDNQRRRVKSKTFTTTQRDVTKPIPLSRIIQIFHHILEDPDQDSLKILRKQRWLTHDIHETIRDLVSLGIMQDANGYSNLHDKKTFYLLADQSFVELISEPYGISLTSLGIKKKKPLI